LYPQVGVLVLDDAHVPLPDNDAPDAVQRDFCAALCLGVLGVTVDAAFTSEDYDDGFRQRQHAWYVAELTRRGIPYTLVHGPLEQRVRQVLALLAAA
jgi:HTH-type transcriptional regulator, transcriptional repressor of NAD biosynthesis genes